MSTSRITTNAKDLVINASTCGFTSLLGTIIFFFFWSWVGYYDEQGPLPGILTGAAFSLLGGIVAGVAGVKIRITNEKLRRGICGAITGMFSLLAVEQIVPKFLFTFVPGVPFASFGPLSSQLFALMMGAITGASAGSFSAFYIGKPAFTNSAASALADSAVSAAEGCALASVLWVWVVAASFVHPDPDFNSFIFFAIIVLFSFIIAIIAAVIGGILGGPLGWFGNRISQAGDRAISSLVGTTCGATLGAIITMILLVGMIAQ